MGGVDIPGFKCEEDGSTPGNEGSDYFAYDDCDAPNVLNQECDPDSKFQVLRRGINPSTGASDGIYIVAHCRKMGGGYNEFSDVAMIAHNRNTGATCFFQALDTNMSGIVVAPRLSTQHNPGASTYYQWQDPATTAGQNCIGCHDNGPFLRSPYLGQLGGNDSNGVWRRDPSTPVAADVHYLPGTKMSEQADWNSNSHRYSFIGTDFQPWKTYQVHVAGDSTCTTCHRMAYSTIDGVPYPYPIGTARDYGLRSVAPSQASKSAHGITSPIWMKPGDVTYDVGGSGGSGGAGDGLDPDDRAARKVAQCAEWLAVGTPLPPGLSCRGALFGQGNTCSPPQSQVVGGTATKSTDTTKKGKDTAVIGGVCAPGGPCETGFPYLTSLHGPLYQSSRAQDGPGTSGFRGGYVRTFIDASYRWVFEAGLDATNLPAGTPSPGLPGGTMEAIKHARVASIINPSQCGQNSFSLVNSTGGATPAGINLGSTSKLAILGTLIGNVSPNNAAGASKLWISAWGSSNLLQQTHTTPSPVPSSFEAGGFAHSCLSWNAAASLPTAYQDLSTTSDRQLVPVGLASEMICYLSGIGGNWGHTIPDPANPGGSIQPYAQIYVGPGQDIRLKVFSPGGSSVPISASASCLRVNP